MKVLVLFLLLLVAAGLVVAAAVYRRIRRDGTLREAEQADAILVFGAAVDRGRPSLTVQARVRRAAELYHRGLAPRVLCSGGPARGDSEATVMRRLLIEQGVPSEAIIPDDGGRNTRLALVSAGRFSRGQWKRILAVSSPYHLHRIGREAARQGLDVMRCAADRSLGGAAPNRAFERYQELRETVAVPVYALTAPWHGFMRMAPGRKLRGAVWAVRGRWRALAGEQDDAADTCERLGGLIKQRVKGFSDTEAVRTPASGLQPPVEAEIGCGFGLRHHRLHAGVDFRAAYGMPVHAAAAGEVLVAGDVGPYGNTLVVYHGGGLATVYAHLAGFVVEEETHLPAGAVLGYVGETGRSYGPHLHFEVRVHGSPVEPTVYLQP